MTDNATGYKSAFRAACEELGIRHIRTRPCTPKTNGKAERFVQTSLREWAYARPYESSAAHEAALQPFIDAYNWDRPHSALGHQPPITRIPGVNNLLRLENLVQFKQVGRRKKAAQRRLVGYRRTISCQQEASG